MLVGGGMPIKVGAETIGTFGTAGIGDAPGGPLDEAFALAAIDKVKDQLK
jgi:uncharacterized protein GlcG (DUF336 family)